MKSRVGRDVLGILFCEEDVNTVAEGPRRGVIFTSSAELSTCINCEPFLSQNPEIVFFMYSYGAFLLHNGCMFT